MHCYAPTRLVAYYLHAFYKYFYYNLFRVIFPFWQGTTNDDSISCWRLPARVACFPRLDLFFTRPRKKLCTGPASVPQKRAGSSLSSFRTQRCPRHCCFVPNQLFAMMYQEQQHRRADDFAGSLSVVAGPPSVAEGKKKYPRGRRAPSSFELLIESRRPLTLTTPSTARARYIRPPYLTPPPPHSFQLVRSVRSAPGHPGGRGEREATATLGRSAAPGHRYSCYRRH